MNKILLLLLLSITAYGAVPRQRITIKDTLRPEATKVVKSDYFLKVAQTKVKFIDPYSSNKEVEVTAISQEDFFKHFAPKANRVKLIAVNLYEVVLKRNDPRSSKTFLAYQKAGKYLENSELGPLRVIRTGLGSMKKSKVVIECVDWVWMIKEIVFFHED